MDTEALTTPSPELKKHAQDLKDHAARGAKDLRGDVENLAQDVKDHASRGVRAVKDEANARIDDARTRAADLFETAKAYTLENPWRVFGLGVLIGLILARRRH